MAEDQRPSEEELRQALDRVGVADVLLESAMTTLSLGFRRVSAEARDLPQARLAIEALRALEPVLREGGVDEAVVRDLEQARANLQLAYAKAVSDEQAPPAEHAPPAEQAPPGEEAPPDAQAPPAEQAPRDASGGGS